MASPMEQDSNLEKSEKNCEGKLTSVESLLSQKSGGGGKGWRRITISPTIHSPINFMFRFVRCVG